MPKCVPFVSGEHSGQRIFCPGCKRSHLFDMPRWTWNGDSDRPTFSPSLRVFYQHPETGADVTICHSFVRDGRIEFLSDCEHEMKNRTVELPEIAGVNAFDLDC